MSDSNISSMRGLANGVAMWVHACRCIAEDRAEDVKYEISTSIVELYNEQATSSANPLEPILSAAPSPHRGHLLESLTGIAVQLDGSRAWWWKGSS